MTDESVADQRLYGLPGADQMYFDANTVYESEIEPDYEADVVRAGVTIEEWSVHPPEYHLPAADRITEWMAEWVGDYGEIVECDDWHDAAADVDVLAAAEKLRTVMASKIKYRMANELLRTMTLTLDADDEPLLDGEPLYVKRGAR